MSHKARYEAALPIGLCALAFGMGCGAPGEADPQAVRYSHGQAPSLGLDDQRTIPQGTGLRIGAGTAGAVDTSVHYGMALRTASIKLIGELPTLDDILRIEAARNGAEDPAVAYDQIVQRYLNDASYAPRFNRQMMQYWRDTLKLGGTIQGLSDFTVATLASVNLETGPTFAAKLVADGRNMRDLFTADRTTCPTFNTATGLFTDGSCTTSGIADGDHAGILTNPGFQAQYYGSLAFRRARQIQEIFACQKFPAEFRPDPIIEADYLYTSPWAKTSITSSLAKPTYTQRFVRGGNATTASRIAIASYKYVDFYGACFGCHTTMNHVAPLFMNFDGIGFLRPGSRVQVPIDDAPFAQMADYLPPGEQTAWRLGQPATTIKALGQAIAADPQVAKCTVIRAWNNAMSRADVVNDLALVPDERVKDLTSDFVANGYNYKRLLRQIYTHPHFIRF